MSDSSEQKGPSLVKGNEDDNHLSTVISTQQGTIVQDSTSDNLHRRMTNRQLHILAIGGAVGTALFVSIGNALAAGGPGSLFIAYFLWSFVVAAVNNSIMEMTVLQPVAGGFIRLAGYWFDDALGFMAGWNFFFFEVFAIPFEITAISIVLGFWTDQIPVAATCAVVLVLYALINLAAVRVFGEAEFWLSGGKIFLIIILFLFTFITMVGGNPQNDAYGFRYWKTPGAFAEHPLKSSTGDLARFEGFLACLWSAAFTIVGPEYISLAAAEVVRPRVNVKAAFKAVYWRFGLFFVLGALCVGIVVPWNDPQLQAFFRGTAASGGGTAAASPYAIAMQNLGISVLPHVVNALLLTSIFSAGNTYVYCGTRSLYGMALEGRAPKFFAKCTRKGVPVFAFLFTISFGLLSFLQVSKSSSEVITWLISIITGSAMVNYFIMSITFINYHKACKVQGLDRKSLPYYGWLQPGCAYFSAIMTFLVVIFFGYSSFQPWSVSAFFQNYTIPLIAPIFYGGWKLIKRSKYVKPADVDLVWQRPILDAYEDSFTSPPTGFWREMGQMVGYKRSRQESSRDLE